MSIGLMLSVVDEFSGFFDATRVGVFCNNSGIVVAAAYNEALVFAQTGTGRDEVSADNVLLHTLEGV